MHVVFVSREYPPNPMGGIGTYVANMTKVLARAGVTVSVLTTDCPSAPAHGFDAPHVSEDGHLRVHYLPFADEKWAIRPEARTTLGDALARRDMISAFGPVATAALEKLLLAGRIDAIEAPEYEAPLLDFQIRRAALAPSHPWRAVPTVVHLHSPSHMIFEANDDDTSNRWVRARKANEALSIELADGVLAPSAYLARQVSDWLHFSPGRVEVIPYPIGPLLSVPEGVQAEEGLVLFVGRVEPRKGVFEFVEAAVRAARLFPKAHFRFVGGPHRRGGRSDGPETAELLQSLLPAELRQRFDFPGKVPRETLGAEYARAAFVAVPSRWENYPNTCMEALSCGRPVLVSDQGGMSEMLGDSGAGIVAEGAARKALAENLFSGLCKLLQSAAEERDEMGRRGREQILKTCDDGHIATLHERYYERLKDALRTGESAALSTGALLLGDHPDEGRVRRALYALSIQTADSPRRLAASALPESAAAVYGFAKIPSDAAGRDAGLPPLAERLGEEKWPEVLYVGSCADILPPEALEAAARFFAAHDEFGACALRTSVRGELSSAFRNEEAHLAAPAAFPERWIFRSAALVQSGGVLQNGYYLSDLLRDAVLRILDRGWRIGVLPVAAELSAHFDPQVVRPFAFASREDSIRAVLPTRPGFAAGAIPELPMRAE